jgi:nucleotide-binding universal stress UspA family protein
MRRHPDLQVHLDLRDDDPPRALVDAARTAQLLVVGSRGLGAFRGMLLGAVSNEVLRTAEGTVLVVHAVDTLPEDQGAPAVEGTPVPHGA